MSPIPDPTLTGTIYGHALLEQALAAPRPGASVTSDPRALDSILYGDTIPASARPARHARPRVERRVPLWVRLIAFPLAAGVGAFIGHLLTIAASMAGGSR